MAIYLNDKEIIRFKYFPNSFALLANTPNYEKISFIVSKGTPGYYSFEEKMFIVDTIKKEINYYNKDEYSTIGIPKFLENGELLWIEGDKNMDYFVKSNNKILMKLDIVTPVYFDENGFECYKNLCLLIFKGWNENNKKIGIYLLVLDTSEKFKPRIYTIAENFKEILKDFEVNYSKINNNLMLINLYYKGLIEQKEALEVYEVRKPILVNFYNPLDPIIIE